MLKDAITGLMSLDTIAGLRSRENMRREIESGIQNDFLVKVEDKFDYSKNEQEKNLKKNSLKDITLFSMAESQGYEGRFRQIKFNKPAFPDVDFREEAKKPKKMDSRKDIHYFTFSKEGDSIFQSKVAQSEKPGKRKTKRLDDNRSSRIVRSGKNIIGPEYGKDHFNANRKVGSDRDELYRKLMTGYREKERPDALVRRVDLVYEQMLGRDLKF